MERDFYGGIIAGIAVIVMVVTAFVCIGGKYQELSKRAEEYNKEIWKL